MSAIYLFIFNHVSSLVSGIFYIILAVPTVYICSCLPQILSIRSRAYMHKKPYIDLNSNSIIINLDLFSFQNKITQSYEGTCN